MCLLIETIRVEGGRLQNIACHNERFNRSRRELFGIFQESSLEDLINLPGNLPEGKIKCRLVYSQEINEITFSPYTIQKVLTLQIIEVDIIEYAYKFHDRQPLEKLRRNTKADDILIVRNGYITDTSYANIVFWDGIKWITPALPLLPGTMRSKLIQEGRIQTDELQKQDLRLFKSARVINAMLDLEDCPSIDINRIFNK